MSFVNGDVCIERKGDRDSLVGEAVILNSPKFDKSCDEVIRLFLSFGYENAVDNQ